MRVSRYRGIGAWHPSTATLQAVCELADSHMLHESANMFHSLSVSHHTLGVTLTVFLLFVAHVSVVFTYYSPLVI